jgi:hypothetical protein
MRIGVVIAQVDEVEVLLDRQRRDLVERCGRVATLRRVHVKVAAIPASLARQHDRVERRLRPHRERRRVVADDIDEVAPAGRLELRLADRHRPRAGRERPRQVAARRLLDADDRVLEIAAAPATKSIGAPHAPVEDHEVIVVGVDDLDLLRADRHVEGDVDVVAAVDRHVGLEMHHRDHGEERQHQWQSISAALVSRCPLSR